MHHIKFSKHTGGSAVRTDTVEGICLALPTKKTYFKLYGKSLSPAGNFRIVTTNIVEEIDKKNNTLQIKTASGSIYIIEIIEENITSKDKITEIFGTDIMELLESLAPPYLN
jgi:hypothetical protein